MPDNIDRRHPEPTRFTEKLSIFMVMVAAAGAFWVLIDPRMEEANRWGITFGLDGFSRDLKGAVISAILIGGWSAVKEYWLGASDGGRNQSAALSRIAEGAAPAAATVAATAAAVAAAAQPTSAIKTDEVRVEANTAEVNVGKKI